MTQAITLNKPIYEVQGLRFVLGATTPARRKALKAINDARDEAVQAYIEACETALAAGEAEPEVPEGLGDDYRYLFDVFCALTEGPHDALDFDAFDVKYGEAALADFLPASAATMMRHRGFLPSPTL